MLSNSRSAVVLFLVSFVQFASILVSAESVLIIEPQHVLNSILSHPEATFNDKQELRRIGDKSDGQEEYAVYAKSPIQKDEVLYQVPWDLILSVPEITPKTENVQKESSKEAPNSGDEDEDDEEEYEDEDEDENDSDDDNEGDDDDEEEMLVNCNLVKLLQQELHNHQNGKKSEDTHSSLGPYLSYVLHKSKKQRKVPSTFTESGQDLFVDLLFDWAPDEERDKYRAPPVDSIFVASECSTEIDEADESSEGKDVVKQEDMIEESTTMWVVQKADSRILVPLVHDIYPHGNGDKANNTKIQWKDGEYYQVVASRDISEGEVLKHSVNLCTGCLATEKGRKGRRTLENYGTAAIFRDFGFIQGYPQTWLLDDCGFEIDLVEPESVLKEGTSRFTVEGKDLQVTWITHLPKEGDFRNELLKYLFGLHRRLLRSKHRAINLYHPDHNGSTEEEEGIEDDSGSEDEEEDATDVEFERPSVPLDEWDAMLKYLDALTDAVAIAHNSLVSDQDRWLDISMISGENVCANTHSSNAEDGMQAARSHYDDLKPEEDDLDYSTPTCNEDEWMQFDNYKEIETVQTLLQKAKFHGDLDTGDICMNSNSTLQICISYRPQYNEMMVHYPARFVKSIKRVLIVGGGNSMLLHEVLKYPTLKNVVGLELDQTITRKSFKHFHVQPHFDDERVEWWFGDISKSLGHLLRVKATFDLIVVDVYEVSKWNTVVRGLKAFETLALLLHKDGVLVKNGRYMDHVRSALDYGVQVHFDIPKTCSETVVFASKSIDFLHHDQKDHGVYHHFLLDLDEMDDQFDYMHDYYTNTSPQKCTWSLEQNSKNENQIEPYGIHRVIDIEGISKSNFSLKDVLQQVGRSAKLNPMSTSSFADDENGNIGVLVVLKEGYISARLWTSEGYLAVGVHLWSSFSKLALVEAKLLQKLGTKSRSSFQVVVGGMKESSYQAALEPKQSCESPSTRISSNVVGGRGTLRPVITEVLNLIYDEEIIAGVVCGPESSGQPCMAKEVLEATPRISQVIVFWTCPGLQPSSDTTSNLSDMSECERNLLEQLDVTMDANELYFDMFVVDNSAPIEMAQIFNSIWNNPKYREWYLTGHFNVFLGISLRPPEENYHRQMLDRYRRHIRYDPVMRAELLIEIDGARMEVDVVSVGDLHTFYNLHVIESRIQRKIGSLGKVEVQHILGGQRYKEDSEAEEFDDDLYDLAKSVKRYRSQKPVGRETILQFRFDPPQSRALLAEKLGDCLQQTMKKIGFEDAAPTTYLAGPDGRVMVYNNESVGVVFVWNGNSDININLLSVEKDIADDFLELFQISDDDFSFSLHQRDDYPRGIGPVVNFAEDIIANDT